MSQESVAVSNESPKKLHWTQMPENKERLIKMRKASVAKRYGHSTKDKALHARRAFCNTCNLIVLDKYAHRISYPKHDLDFDRHLTAQEIAKAEKRNKKSARVAARMAGGRNPARSVFCENCNKAYSNKYEHFEAHPTHILKQPNGQVFVGTKTAKPQTKTNGRPHGFVSVLGSPVWDAAKSKDATSSDMSTRGEVFTSGFKAGYDFRAGLEAYATEQNIPIEALVSSAASALESEQ